MKIIEDVETFLASIPEGIKGLYPKAQELLAEIKAARATDEEISQARESWEGSIDSGDLAIDTGAMTSRDKKGRAMWVQAWVFMNEDEEGEEDGEKEEDADEG